MKTQKKRIYPLRSFAEVVNHVCDVGVQNISVILELLESITDSKCVTEANHLSLHFLGSRRISEKCSMI